MVCGEENQSMVCGERGLAGEDGWQELPHHGIIQAAGASAEKLYTLAGIEKSKIGKSRSWCRDALFIGRHRKKQDWKKPKPVQRCFIHWQASKKARLRKPEARAEKPKLPAGIEKSKIEKTRSQSREAKALWRASNFGFAYRCPE